MQNQRKTTEVAVGVLIRADGRVLLASRPQGKPYAGYWEFPGGKIEPGESVTEALARELQEELGIVIAPPMPWVTLEHDYPHAYVRLHFCRVHAWSGVPQGREGQQLDFFDPIGELPEPVLPATYPALKWLRLPDVYAISNAAALGVECFIDRCAQALATGTRLIQVREPTLAANQVADLWQRLLPLVRAAHARLLVNSRHDRALWALADGVHLTSADLMALTARPERLANGQWLAASVHDRMQLEQAARMGCDFVVVGPVQRTATHPDVVPMGWETLATLSQAACMPVYALGGLVRSDVERAQRTGAHGLALMRGAWD